MKPRIPLFKVFMAEYVEHDLAKVLHSGHIAQGPQVERFEGELREALSAPWDVLTVNSGTSALELGLYLAGAGARGRDNVVTTPMTCSATNGAIVRSGARLNWADVNPHTGLIDPESVQACINDETIAIMAVDWGGAPCDYEALKSFGLPVIEDAAHAFGASIKGRSLAQAGGDYVAWSFQAIKHLTTVDGGLLKTPEEDTERARKLRWFGLDRRSEANFRAKQDIGEVGFKMHMNDVDATIGLANLPHIESILTMHRSNAKFYFEMLYGAKGVTCPPPNQESSWWLYTLLVDDRDSFERHMQMNGIETSVVHSRNDKYTGFADCNHVVILSALLGVEYFSQHAVAIPVGWWVTEEDRERIAEEISAMEPKTMIGGFLAESASDRETMRLIRNSCREFMTRSTSEISEAEQERWWRDREKNQIQTYLFEQADGETVGYGLVSRIEGKLWLSGGLLPAFRGKGLGRHLFAFLLEKTGSPCWLEVRADNAPAIATYKRLGFQQTARLGGVITMATGVVVTPFERAPLPEELVSREPKKLDLQPFRRPR